MWLKALFVLIGLFFFSLQSLVAQCPQAEAIFVDACGVEQQNEFVIIHSGASGFNTANIVVDFPLGNNAMSASNNDINTNIDNFPPGTPCGLTTGNTGAYTGCSNLIAIGPGFQVPPNQIVVLQISSGSTNGLYDFSSLCGSGQCVYVISSSCMRTIGGFTNGMILGGIRTTHFEYGGGCSESITYDRGSMSGNNGDYFLPQTNTYGNAGCVVPPTSPAQNPQTPGFNIEDEYCVGDTPDILPNTSNNGITGSWVPATINTSSPGTSNYIFTPNPGQCAINYTLMVTVDANVIPVFSFNTDYCQNETPDNLPSTSNNGISGTWNPGFINTSAPGTTSYTFTPTAGICATIVTVMVTVDPLVTPIFTIENNYCVGETPDNLPNTSNNGINGTWNPTSINTSTPGTTMYTFTPAANQCAANVILSVTIVPNVIPTFNIDNNYCFGETPDNLPTTSNNGITGIWSPPTINTSAAGTTNYNFTPDVGQCADDFILTVTVSANVTPIFPPIGDLCENSSPPSLPNTSANGITGTWNPSVINTSIPGMSNYTFTPDMGQCADPVTISINILEIPRASISGTLNLCPGQCGEVNFNFSGGSGLYNLNMQIIVGAFSIPFSVPGATVSTTLTICYNGAGFLPQFQPPSTLVIPMNAPPGSATLLLNSIADGNGGPCPTGVIVNNMMSLTLRTRPVVFNAQLTVCDEDNDGLGIFNLTDAEGDVTGNDPGSTVLWYSDSGLTNQINNPTMYSAMDGTIVYVLVTDAFGCENTAQVTLNVEDPQQPDLPTFTVCLTDPPYNLPTMINGVSGNWSDINGHVSGNQFDPSGLTEGNYTITFTPNPGQCFIPANTVMMVTSGGPIPLVGIPQIVCTGLGILILPDMPNGVSGIWSSPSPHLSGNQFNVASAGIGMYDLTFTPNDPNSCFLPNTIQINVIDNASLIPPDFGDICENSGMFSLGNTVNGVTGNWGNSPHITANMFNTNVGVGNYLITFYPDDDCTNDVDVTISITPSMNLLPLTFSNVCNTSPPINLPVIVQGVAGVWTLNSVVILIFDPQVQGNGTFTLEFTPLPNQCANGFSTTITVGSVFAGDDTNIQYCIMQNPVVNLLDFLSSNAGTGGTWEQGGMPVLNPDMYDLSVLGEGIFDLSYILSDPTCGNDTAFITFEIQNSKEAGNDGSLTLCQSQLNNVNFASLLGTFSSGGLWTNNRNLTFDMSNLISVNLSGLPVGSTEFIYHFDAGICPGDTAVITIQVDSFFNAGVDKSGDICINSVIILGNLTDVQNTGGSFEDVNGYGGLMGIVWDATGKPEGEYIFIYVFPTNNSCPGDTAIYTISVRASISAGEDVFGEYCDGAGFIASDFLPASASPGGRIMNGPFVVSFGMVITGNLLEYQYLYITGDGMTCPFDTAVWTINRVDKPNINFIINDISLCEGDCGDIVIRHNSNQTREITILTLPGPMSDDEKSFTIIPGQDLIITVCNDSSMIKSFYNNYGLAFPRRYYFIQSYKEKSCEYILNPGPFSTVSLIQSPNIMINETLCPGEYFQIGNTTFDASNPSGTVLIPGVGNDCDTTYNVDLSFYAPAVGSFTNEVCDPNYSITIGGTVFNMSNRQGSVLIPNGSINGCDSLVMVDILFNNGVLNNINQTTCNPDFSIMVGNTIYNINRPSGQVILNNAAANGCDSIIVINLTFKNPSINNIQQETCDADFSLMVENTIFNFQNPTGQVIISGGAKNGCDSIVNVSLSFLTFAIGDEILLPECDENVGSITFKNAGTPGPFTLFVNGTQEDVFTVLPFEKYLSPGSYMLLLVSNDGCSKSFTIDIPDNSKPDISLDSINTGGDIYQLSLVGDVDRISNISWTPTEIFSCDDCLNTVATPSVNILVKVEYQYGEMCLDSFSFLLKKSIIGEFEIPNVIKPGSGANGSFYIQAPKNFNGTILQMNIYDRWGNKVFFNQNVPFGDSSQGWDGTFSGRDAIPGVYVYSIEILDISTSKVLQFFGDLTVIR